MIREYARAFNRTLQLFFTFLTLHGSELVILQFYTDPSETSQVSEDMHVVFTDLKYLFLLFHNFLT